MNNLFTIIFSVIVILIGIVVNGSNNLNNIYDFLISDLTL